MLLLQPSRPHQVSGFNSISRGIYPQILLRSLMFVGFILELHPKRKQVGKPQAGAAPTKSGSCQSLRPDSKREVLFPLTAHGRPANR